MELPEAFYLPIDDSRYRPTMATTSPWDDRFQHGGPPSALAVHALQQELPRPDLLVARVVVEFLGVIPREEMTVRVAVVRPGRRIELSRVTLTCGERTVVEASVWRIAQRNDVPVPPAVLARERAQPIPPLPPAQVPAPLEGMENWGYGRAIEWRFAGGGWRQLGPVAVWSRLRIPLVAGRATSGVERIATVADSANGLSREFDMRDFTFVPTSIALTLDRSAASEWTFLSAETHVGGEGLGFTSCTLGDEAGIVGVASQTLYFEPSGKGAQGRVAPPA